MNPASSIARSHSAPTEGDWLGQLEAQAAVLDGIEVAMCAFDAQDRALAWNRTFLRFFPEHEGHIAVGEHYGDNLRRFYAARLDASEIGNLERHVQAGIARYWAQSSPFEFEHRGLRLQVSSQPFAGGGRIRAWRALTPLPASSTADAAFAADHGGELLDYVPEALVVCGRDRRIIWANASFCSLYRVENRQQVLGSTLEVLYEAAWKHSRVPAHPDRDKGMATLRENLRFTGASFELPLPEDGYCRVIARPARDGAVFYALIDISALKRYESALQLTLDNAGRGIIRYDAEGRVLLFNRQALELLALPAELLAGGARITDVIRFQTERGDFIPDDGAAGMAGFNDTRIAEKAGDVFATGTYLRRTSSGRCLEISTHPLPDGGAVRTYSDVTAYVQAQSALSEKTRALQITLDSMIQGISAIDATGRLVFWNRRYQELLQLPEALLQERPTMDRVVRFQIERGDFGPNFERVDAVARGFVAVGDRLAPLQGPQTYMRRSPEGKTFDVTTLPLPDGGVVRTFTDITASVQTQEALAQKQAQLGALVSNLPDRVWLKDARGTYLLCNAAWQRHHGVGESEVLGRTSIELFGAEKGRRQAESDRRAMESATPVSSEEHDFGPDGNLRFAEVVKVPMRDDQGQCTGLLGIARDITVRKQEEAALIKAKEEAQEASGAKSRFLSSMSHEIRTPMNAILGMLALLRGTSLSERQEDYAAKAEGAGRALLSLLNDILDFSKIEAGKMRLDRQPFSLEAMLSDLSVILSSNVGGRDIELLYDLDPRVPDGLVGDDMRLRQILINLGGNAVKFTERGEVIVRTRLVDGAPDQATIEFSVQDTGIGMSPEQQARLFGDYVQATDETARQFGGTGLGLGICRRLTELMGSSLQLASAAGVGSRFWFTLTLPLAPKQAAVPPPQPGDAQPRILIVDDNPLARDSLAGLARAAGWQGDTAQDGLQALERLRSAAAVGMAYDAVFVDWIMPGLDGWQTCSRIRELPLRERTPLVIMVTAHGRDMLDRRAPSEQQLLDGYLVKPVTAGMLQQAFQRARHLSGNKPVAAPVSPQPLAGFRFLLAEDNPVNQQIAIELLSRRGAQVDLAGNGQEALDRLAAEPGAYDAVLMDVQMPVMDGLTATREIRKQSPAATLPIIAMTANAMDTDRQACLAAGMDAHVAKPFAIDDVVATLLRYVRPGSSQPATADAKEKPLHQPPIFNRAAAVERLGGDDQLLDMVLPVFRGNLHEALRDLAPDFGGKDLPRLLHAIKGMAANVGAERLAAVAAEGEVEVRAHGPQAVDVVVRRVRDAIEDVLREIGDAAPQ